MVDKKIFGGGVGVATGYLYLYTATDVVSKYLLKSRPDGLIDTIIWGLTNAPAYLGIAVGVIGGLWAASNHYLRKKEGGN